MINLNDMATEITVAEGGAVSVNVAQVKEVMKLFLQRLAQRSDEEVKELLDRYRG